MKLLPIEPGCGAIIIQATKGFEFIIGLEVKVTGAKQLSSLWKCGICHSKYLWPIRSDNPILTTHVACDCHLMRISPDADQFKLEQHQPVGVESLDNI